MHRLFFQSILIVVLSWIPLRAEKIFFPRIDTLTANLYAETRNQLRETGRPIPENDIWISALSLQHLLPIVSRDQHFDSIPGVKRLSWQERRYRYSDSGLYLVRHRLRSTSGVLTSIAL